ncbi:unnamed protein product [Toxocara canis]|uniref:Uncharacterized protein n=1 Tax=Toxocara canis TaxID=6265 RepID=A0A183UVM0_TOXCA|nr:unnamed protein product [Toxocara canis]
MASNGAMSRIAPSGARQVSKKEHTSSSLSYRNININNEGTGEKNNLEKVASTAPQVIASNQHAVPVVSHMVKATFSVYTDDEEAGDGYENRHLTVQEQSLVQLQATRPSLRKPLADITLQTSFSQFSETTVENVESLSESSDGRTAVESVAVSSSSMIADTTVSEDSLYGSVNDENSEYHTAPMTLSDKVAFC